MARGAGATTPPMILSTMILSVADAQLQARSIEIADLKVDGAGVGLLGSGGQTADGHVALVFSS